MAKRTPPDTRPVDLGISALLAEEERRAAVDSARASAGANATTAILDLGSPEDVGLGVANVESTETAAPAEPIDPPSQFETLAAAAQWDRLALACEAGLAPHQSSDSFPHLERRVWWIRSQQKSEAMPLLILAAPLEEVAQKLRRHTSNPDWSSELAANPECEGISHARVSRVCAELDRLLLDVAVSLDQLGEGATARRLRELQTGDAQSETSPPEMKKVGRRDTADAPTGKDVSSSTSPGDASGESRSTSVRDRLGVGLPPPGGTGAHARIDKSRGRDRPIESEGALWLKVVVIAFLLTLILGFFTLRYTGYFSEVPLAKTLSQVFASVLPESWTSKRNQVELEPLRDGMREPSLKVPPLPPVEKASQLEAILEDYRNAKPPNLQDRQVGPRDAVGEAARGGESAREVRGIDAGAPQQRTQEEVRPPERISSAGAVALTKETVNTSGPIEPANFPRGPGRDRYEGARDAGPGTQGRPVDRPVSSRPRGERPGFEDFKTPKVFVTLVETDVMTVPSLRGRNLDVLPAGVEILVEGKEGYWLRIRSQKGNRGYILAQDAVTQTEASPSRSR